MFIKTAYEKRLKNEQNDNILNKLKLRPKIHKIGSIKNGRINYDQDEQFFAGDDIPLKAKQTHDEIREFIDPDILELRKKQWNQSSLVPKNPILEETFERKLIKIKLGLMDQPIPVIVEKKIEEGCDSRNKYTGWNVSTEQILRERKQAYLLSGEKDRLNSKIKEEYLLKNYIKPIEEQMNLTQELRKEKVQEKDLREEIRKNYKFENPKASKEKTDGAVFRLAYENKLLKTQIKTDDPTGSLGKPDLSQTLKETKSYRYYHNGKWECSKEKTYGKDTNNEGISQDGNEKPKKEKIVNAWSCCRNEDFNSEGCYKVVVDKFRWNYSSPTN